MADDRPRLLILSFSPIASDARVLKQIAHFRDWCAVTTCGYGPAPTGVKRHVRIPEDEPIGDLNGRLITARLYKRAYWSLSAVRWTWASLRHERFDVVLANDVESAPLAVRLAPKRGVHVDLHEYSPRVHENNPAWMRRIAPYIRWICRSVVARVSSTSTVSEGLAREYYREFGFRPEVVTNATPYHDLRPSEVHDPIRLVHSGVCLRNREIEKTILGVQESTFNCTLDLFLMPNDPVHLEELRMLAARTPGRVRILDPVPYRSLIQTLSSYDLGIFVLPPNSFSHEWALPNKLFDYVQARLGALIGPSPEMVAYVEEFRLGLVSPGFAPQDIAYALDSLDAGAVAAFKHAADAAARELSAEEESARWGRAIKRILYSGDIR